MASSNLHSRLTHVRLLAWSSNFFLAALCLDLDILTLDVLDVVVLVKAVVIAFLLIVEVKRVSLVVLSRVVERLSSLLSHHVFDGLLSSYLLLVDLDLMRVDPLVHVLFLHCLLGHQVPLVVVSGFLIRSLRLGLLRLLSLVMRNVLQLGTVV